MDLIDFLGKNRVHFMRSTAKLIVYRNGDIGKKFLVPCLFYNYQRSTNGDNFNADISNKKPSRLVCKRYRP